LWQNSSRKIGEKAMQEDFRIRTYLKIDIL
jgi:hypothetical protein